MKHPFKRILSLLLIAALLCGLLVLPVGAAPNDGTAAPAVGPSGSEESASPNAVIPSDNEESALPSGDGKVHLDFEQVDDSLIQDDLLAQAAFPEEEPLYADTDSVRVSIVLESAPAIDTGFGRATLASSQAAQTYRARLEQEQAAVQTRIETDVLAGQPLDVCWNFTLGANLISANVPYGKLDEIAAVPGVKQVVLETKYEPAVAEKVEESDLNDFPGEGVVEPQMAVSVEMNGTTQVWDLGYTGAGTRIAIIDTGLDTDHQSFDPGAYEYAIAEDAEKAGMALEEYAAHKHFLTVEEIEAVLPQLNAAKRSPDAKAEDFYVNAKAPFGYNYIDQDFDITHDNDKQGEHGSHVAGIAAANRYIPQEDGTYAVAVDTVQVVGNAPDAQLIVMKVGGKGGGIYESDYFAAIEDAVLLKCDVANLSLGSPMAGFTTSDLYQSLLDSLSATDLVVSISAGNAGSWADQTIPGALYTEDVNFDTVGSPGSYANGLTVASVENDGVVNSRYLLLGENPIFYNEPGNRSTTHPNMELPQFEGLPFEYFPIPGYGTAEDFASVPIRGMIALVSRGENSFSEKAANAQAAGFGGLIVYNNVPGSFTMDMSDFSGDIPTISISQADGQKLLNAAQTVEVEQNGEPITYQVGQLTGAAIGATLSEYFGSEYKTMSAFSSWGVPGDLSMKPEIAAPGGMIYSVNGADASGTAYETMSGTSMAAPQVAGMTALVMQYIRENHLSQPGVTDRALAQSLLMSTANPLQMLNSNHYYHVYQQGAGLAAVDKAVSATSYLVMGEDATASWQDGKIKAELGDDPDQIGEYTFSFTIHDISGEEQRYGLNYNMWRYNPANSDTTVSQDHLANIGQRSKLTVAVNGETIDSTYDSNFKQHWPVTVPTGESVTITVTYKLGSATAAINRLFPNGTFLEGFFNLSPLQEDGALADPMHSIPFLAFFGDWSDSSMYEKGCWQLYRGFDSTEDIEEAGLKQYYVPTLSLSNTLLSRKAGQIGLYYVGGNPAAATVEYRPERNAWNNQERSVIDSIAMTFVRNAAATRVIVKNADTGEVLLQSDTGPARAAFYHPNAGGWYYTNTKLPLRFRGEGMEEGTRLEIICQAATEYSLRDDGTVNWDNLGAGSTFTVPLRIDNTEPELSDVLLNENTQTLTFTARDNQWVAGAVLLSSNGTKRLAEVEGIQETEGASVAFEMDISHIQGQRLLLAVMDYAGNYSTYRLFRGKADAQYLIPHGALAFEHTTNMLVSFDVGNTNSSTIPAETLEVLGPTTTEFCGAAEAGGILYLTATDGWLYAMNKENVTEILPVVDLGMILADLCYDPLTNRLYGVTDMDYVTSAESGVYAFDLSNLRLERAGTLPFPANTITCDDKGNFYTVVFGKWDMGYVYELREDGTVHGTLNGPGALYRFRLDKIDSPELLVQSWNQHDGLQSLAWNPASNSVFWASYYKQIAMGSLEVISNDLYEYYETEDGSWTYRVQILTDSNYSNLDILDVHISALVFPDPDLPSGWPEASNEIQSVSLPETLELVPGEETLLQAVVTPWWVTDYSVTWSSADPSVVSVNTKGLLIAKSVGETTVTATSGLDATKQASVSVRVVRPDVILRGIVTREEGVQSAFAWDLSSEDPYSLVGTLSCPVSAVAFNKEGDIMFASTQEKNDKGSFDLLCIDPYAFTVTVISQKGISLPAHGLTYLREISNIESNNTVMGFNGSMIMFPVGVTYPEPEYQDFYDALAQTSGASSFVAIACGGVEPYVSNRFALDRADLVYLLDDTGAVWKTHIVDGQNENGHSMYYFDIQNQSGMWDPIPTDLMCNLDTKEARSEVSLLCDETTGDLYLSTWDGKDTEIYRLRYDAVKKYYVTTRLGVMENVGPVSLYDAAYVGDYKPPVDKDYLKVLIWKASVEERNYLVYTKASMDAVRAALAAAKEVAANESATQREVDAAAGALSKALSALQYRNNGDLGVDLNALYAAIWRADQISELSPYTDESVALFEAALEHAREVYFNEDATQEEIDDATDALMEAVAGLVEKPAFLFDDVQHESKFYYEPVYWAFFHDPQITNGTDDTHFSPDNNCTRGQVVTFLWRAMGCPEPTQTEHSFTDVKEGAYYYRAMLWAVETGVTTGTSATTFGPNKTATRGQVVTFLWRAMGSPEPTQTEHSFTDVKEGAYYYDAMLWAVETGVTSGISRTTFGPNKTATRGHVVTFLWRAVGKNE